ncbi:MAG: hypothetical protein APR63_11545 [Desulfuromonas sp. SDB]|nr:MAG: hypothetical protein APR63_11545 [Desulfuromonas sp. SDB]
MHYLHSIQTFFHSVNIPYLLIVGLITCIGFYVGKSMKLFRLPSIIGFMLLGLLLGPSGFDLLNEQVQIDLSFITEIALGFVALSIGMELKLSTLRKLGKSIVVIIFSESIFAFILVTGVIYIFEIISGMESTTALPLALIFGSIAPASAPAGTVAVIKEYRAKGTLTNALYAVVGFDDGLGIIIFGFASAIAKNIIISTNGSSVNILAMLFKPLLEIVFSIVIGVIGGYIFNFLVTKLKSQRDVFILTFGLILSVTGVCKLLDISLILTNMVIGIIIVNNLHHSRVSSIGENLSDVMPLLFILFFGLAGANLHLSALPSLGLLGLIYILSRTAGLMGGATLGAVWGRAEPKLKKYLGLGILSQAGVAIGLALIVKRQFYQMDLGSRGDFIGATVLTTITATCIIFELIGPITTKIGLQKAGEISKV